jgi:XRE family transcriptional regulator, fatty acid utilization regulator
MVLESEASCPLWAAHDAFERPGRICVQSVEFMDSSGQDSQWLTLARTVEGSGAPGGEGARFVVVLGLEARLAGQLAQARGLALDPAQPVPTGPGCARCQRPDCRQRSLPPRGLPLAFDERTRGLTPFDFAR